MRLVDLIPAQIECWLAGGGLIAIAGGTAALAWQVQKWRYDKQLAEQGRLQTDILNQKVLASAAQQRSE